jgi:hypothetical protein
MPNFSGINNPYLTAPKGCVFFDMGVHNLAEILLVNVLVMISGDEFN